MSGFDVHSELAEKTPRGVLVDWANSQSGWVRRVVGEVLHTGAPLSENALDVAYQMSLIERELAEGEVESVPRLEIDDGNGETIDSLRLKHLKDVQGVNRLAANQEISFNPRMTVLFGENATGKSGYVRILKRAADVRSAEPILPDINDLRPERPHAEIAYQLGDHEDVFDWHNEAGVSPFTRISIFDPRAVRLHVDDDLEYVYTPRDLALFPLVRDAIQAIKDRLLKDLKKARPAGNPFIRHFRPGSLLYGKLEALGPTTDISELERLARLSDGDSTRLERLREKVDALRPVAVDTQLQVAETDRTLFKRLRDASQKVLGHNWEGYETARKRVATAQESYEQATKRAFAGVEVPGVLGEAWRRFVLSGDAYLKSLGLEEYPQEDDRCLYCQQELGDAARELLGKYYEYCNNTFKEELDEATSERETAASPLVGIDLRVLEESISGRVSSIEQTGKVPATLSKGRSFVQLLAEAREALEDGSAYKQRDLVELATTVNQHAEANLEKAKKLIADLSMKGKARKEEHLGARTELTELHSRFTLRELLPKIREHVEQAIWASKAETIATNRFPQLQRSLTEASKIASEDLLNRDFANHFEAERVALTAPKVRLDFPGRAGQAKRKKSLSPNHRLSMILSEGEQKVIAIADFLAEAAIRAASAPLVFDDPVSSLDYKRLKQITNRLYELSANHQVIVFTHNIWFAMSLMAKFEKQQNNWSYYDVSLGPAESVGVVTGGAHPRYDTPKKLGSRINVLIQDAGAASGETQQALVESIYSRLRSWCEVFIEQEVFRNVTQRFQPHVMMTMLPQIRPDRMQEAIDVTSELFKKCCRITDAHSQPLETLNIRPTLVEAKKDWEKAQETRSKYIS